MCEHEFKMFTNLNHPGFRLVCIKCYKTQQEIDLEQQLAAANALNANLQQEISYQNKQIAKLHEDLIKALSDK